MDCNQGYSNNWCKIWRKKQAGSSVFYGGSSLQVWFLFHFWPLMTSEVNTWYTSYIWSVNHWRKREARHQTLGSRRRKRKMFLNLHRRSQETNLVAILKDPLIHPPPPTFWTLVSEHDQSKSEDVFDEWEMTFAIESSITFPWWDSFSTRFLDETRDTRGFSCWIGFILTKNSYSLFSISVFKINEENY